MKTIKHDQHDKRKSGIMSGLRGYFIAGILVTAPIAITLYLTWAFLMFVDTNVARLIPPEYNPNYYLPFSVPGLGVVAAFVFFVVAGWFAKNFFGRLTIRASEYILDKMPVVRSLYGALKQIFETVMANQSEAFRDVVVFEYPRKDSWTLGFVTGVTKGEVQDLTNDEVVNVYVPTTPNPTSGFLLFIPKKDLIYIKMSVEDAIKMIVSGGIITPPNVPQAKIK
jgi:uncharacterized membrane protein